LMTELKIHTTHDTGIMMPLKTWEASYMTYPPLSSA
jgi:hypothetical protein